jgi:crossover junction endodeoxyribonuclease RuvC
VKAIIGIDPGQSGAIAVLSDGRVVSLHDMPCSARLHGKGQQVDAAALASIIRAVMCDEEGHVGWADVEAILESVSAMPGQGVSSMFRFGESLGIVIGVIGTLGIPFKWVTPQKWKKSAGLLGKDKDASRTLAIQRFPEVADRLARKKDAGRSDAICIAVFGG